VALVAALVAATTLAACAADRAFKTTAVYEVGDGLCSLRIEARGVVSAGHDVSREAAGTVIVSPKSGHPTRLPIALKDGVFSIDGASGAGLRFEERLADAGCPPNAAEAPEIASALSGVLAGPKGTLMPGQTKAIKVLSVVFDR
jgi:hypothetical protein